MFSNIKKLASDILDVGKSKLRINPERIGKAEEALTREDVRALIKDKIIYVKRKPGFKRIIKKKKRGQGARRGTKNARKPGKEKWMANVRAQRKYLAQLVANGNLNRTNKRKVYLRIKGGSFKGKKALLMHLKDNNLYIEKVEK